MTAAGFWVMSWSSMAQVSAARRTLRASLRLPAESVSWQHLPTAQQRRLGSGSGPGIRILSATDAGRKPVTYGFEFKQGGVAPPKVTTPPGSQ